MAVAPLRLGRQFHQFLRLLHRSGQRLFADHVLARLKRGFRDRKVHEIRSADVYRVHGRVFQNAPVVGFGLRHAELRGQLIGLLDLRLADGIDLDKPQAANAFQVHAAHKARAEYCGLQMLHDRLRLISERIIYRKKLLDWYHSDMVVRIRFGQRTQSRQKAQKKPTYCAGGVGTSYSRLRHRAPRWRCGALLPTSNGQTLSRFPPASFRIGRYGSAARFFCNCARAF